MKKLIISLAFFLALVGVSVYEIVMTSKTFSELEQLTQTAQTAAEFCVEYKQNSEKQREKDGEESGEIKMSFETAEQNAMRDISEIETYWGKRKIGAMFFGNHTVVKSVDERIATLKMQAKSGQWEDAAATAAAMRTYFFDLKDDTHPTLSNLF